MSQIYSNNTKEPKPKKKSVACTWLTECQIEIDNL